AVDEALQEEIQHLTIDVGDAAAHVATPSRLARAEAVGGAEGPNLGRLLDLSAVLFALRQDGSKGARDADRLIQLLNRSLDVGARLEYGVGVENELDVGVELARLTFDCRRLADRRAALNREKIDVVQPAERRRALDGAIVAPVVDEDDTPGPHGLLGDRRET